MTHHDATPSDGERRLQAHLGSRERADAFYDRQVHPYLTAAMRDFVHRQSMVFLSTADARGQCDATFRAGPPGFVVTLDDRTLAYPEYRGNGVLASAGNITENPHIGLLFMDFTHDHIGLHVNGSAGLVSDYDLRGAHPRLPTDTAPGRRPLLWTLVNVHEAYVHCSKHIPHLEPAPRTASGHKRPKDADYFTENPAATAGVPGLTREGPLGHPHAGILDR
ncbi:pyridoxamine 5'-phosphate oxidase family protein [Streptomyces sp. NBC_00178]|uniref:pyridoxamine 5'-phosphate oxidase family protein n=1 Tax=Streptomyces sp. NBC_00178 TaxID=2975672 RepID=UPI002E281582|nr:pyridoxamine 5'-phosphate oxidase family protein [Streptomyces sp. NBC_00178]